MRPGGGAGGGGGTRFKASQSTGASSAQVISKEIYDCSLQTTFSGHLHVPSPGFPIEISVDAIRKQSRTQLEVISLCSQFGTAVQLDPGFDRASSIGKGSPPWVF